LTQEQVWALWRREKYLASTLAQTPELIFRNPLAIPPTLVQFSIKNEFTRKSWKENTTWGIQFLFKEKPATNLMGLRNVSINWIYVVQSTNH